MDDDRAENEKNWICGTKETERGMGGNGAFVRCGRRTARTAWEQRFVRMGAPLRSHRTTEQLLWKESANSLVDKSVNVRGFVGEGALRWTRWC